MSRLSLLFSLVLITFSSFTARGQENRATYYAKKYYGNLTSTGEVLRADLFTAASKQYDYGTILQVTNKNNGLAVQVKVNDCGPHNPKAVLDLSEAAALGLDMKKAGLVPIDVQVVRPSKSGPTCHRGAWAKRLKAQGKPIPPPPAEWVPTETAGALPPRVIEEANSDVVTLPVVKPRYTTGPVATGIAGFYPLSADGQRTTSGELMDHTSYTAAIANYPVGTELILQNVATADRVSVRVTDCGPLEAGHLLTVSRQAASELGILVDGPSEVTMLVEKLGTGIPSCPVAVPKPSTAAAPRVYESAPVTRPAPAPAPAEETFDPDAILFGIKIGAYTKAAGVQKMLGELTEKELAKPYTLTDGKTTRVYTGKFYFQSDAEAYRDEVRAAGYPNAVVRRVQ